MSRTRRFDPTQDQDEQHQEIPTITLHRSHEGWLAKFDGPGSETILAVWGTNVLPTAFTEMASPTEVLFHIAALNPEHHVQLAVVV